MRSALTILLGTALAFWAEPALSVPAANRTSPGNCVNELAAFLARPGADTFNAASRVSRDSCWTLIAASDPDFNRLIKSSEAGNRWAAQYLAGHLKNLDGGNLEDASVALGQFGDHDIERLLRFASTGVISKHEFEAALTMLPLSLADDLHAQVKALEGRRRRVRDVAAAELEPQKTIAMRVLSDAIAALE